MTSGEILWPCGAIALSGWASWKATLALRNALRSRAWPRAPGEILRSELVDGAKSTRGGVRQWMGDLVLYRYRAGGRWRRSERVRFTDLPLWSSRKTVERYPPGTVVEVVYDPDDAECAALEPGPTLLGYVEVAGSVLGLVAGFAWLAWVVAAG
jgi:hypothetical protein